jgi:hypothetical protein
VESTVTWVALVTGVNLLLNSLTFLLILAQTLRLTSYLTTLEWRQNMHQRDRDG